MTLWWLVLAVALGAGRLDAPVAAEAQPPARVSRVGLLATGSPKDSQYGLDTLRHGLRDLGWAEGRDLELEIRWAEGRLERLPALAAALVGLPVDLIVASSTPAALAAKEATKTIPIVFATAGDPEGTLVASLARPGGNVTGLSLLGPELVARQLQLLKEAVPRATRVAILSNPANPYTTRMLGETEAAARSLGLRIHAAGARDAGALDATFQAIARERPHALLVLFDPVLTVNRARIAELANQARLPAMYPHREYADSGGLMAYGADLRDNFRRAAAFVDKILRGAKPGDLPVEQPAKFELVVNLRTARALGLTLPPALLLRADTLIK